jgi:hypothetical protein
LNYNKISAEWESISESEFWKAFVAELQKKRDRYSTNCETKEDNRRDQGAVAVIDEIIGRDYSVGCGKLPNIVVRLLDSTGRESVR